MAKEKQDLRKAATDLFCTAVNAADPAPALRQQLENAPLPELAGGQYIVIAVGKAACSMMSEALQHIPQATQFTALAVPNYENKQEIANCNVMPAGHPVPDENGARAGQAVADLLDRATNKDRVLALISGGGSALLPAPVMGVTLEEKAEVSRVLLAAGFDISEMNMVRQQLSRLKGGGMARLAAPAPLRAYILSDVIGDDLRVIASGPTVGPIGTRKDARNILIDRNVMNKMPASVQEYLNANTSDEPLDLTRVENTLICSNRQSLEAAQAAARGWNATIVNDRLEGDVTEAVELLLNAAKPVPEGKPTVLIFGGETTVNIHGTGMGGRNQELALRFALGSADIKGDWVFLSGGTDGRDGPTDAAGGIVDGCSVARMKGAGIDPGALLENNDSYAALKASGDLLMTGATGTNVADVQIFLRR